MESPRVLASADVRRGHAVASVLFLSALLGFRAALPDLGHLLSAAPTWAVEYAVCADIVEVGRRIHDTTGRSWGYEPHTLAGYPFTALEHNFAGYHLAAVLLPSIGAAAWTRLATVLAWSSVPLLLYLSLVSFGLDRRSAVGGTLGGTVLLATSELELFRATGSIVGGYVSVVAVAVLASAHSFLARRRVAGALGFVASATLALLVHKGAVLLLPVPVLAWVLVFARGEPRRALGLIAVTGACAAAVNLPWIVPMLRYRHWLSEVPWPLWQQHDPLRMLREIVTPVAGFDGFDAARRLGTPLTGSWLARNAVLALGLVGLVRHVERRLRTALAVSLAWLAALAFFGSWLAPVAAFEPFRYVIGYRLLWVVPATFAWSGWQRALAEGAAPRLRPARVVLPMVLVASAALPSFASFVARQPMSDVPPPSFGALVAWARDPASGAGRLMIEDAFLQPDDPGPYGGGYVLGQVALATGRELTGGRTPWIRMQHRFASFIDGEAFGVRVDELTPARLARYLELYDVTGIAAWSATSRAALDAAAPLVTPAGDRGPLRLYRVARESSRFERGHGQVEARWGELALSDVAADRGEIVLRYHWAEGLTATPAAKVDAVQLEDDPVPFIRVVDPPPSFRLRLEP